MGKSTDENHLNIEEIAEGPDEYQPEVRLVEDDITNEEKLNAEIAKIMIANSVVDESEALETSEKYAENDSNTKTVVTEEKQNAQVNAKNESEQEAQCQEEVVSVMEEKYVQVMTMSVIGQIGLPFADDRLVFHKTLELWSTHKGIDITQKKEYQ